MTSDDELVQIELDQDKIKRFKDSTLKKIFRKYKRLNLRIVNQSNLISRLKIDILKPILNPQKIEKFIKKHNRKMHTRAQQSKKAATIQTSILKKNITFNDEKNQEKFLT